MFAAVLPLGAQSTNLLPETLILAERRTAGAGAREWSADDITRAAPRTIDELLGTAPAFRLHRRQSAIFANPTATGVSLRNTGATAASRTLVLLDGIPQNDPFGGWVHWARFDPATLGAALRVRWNPTPDLVVEPTVPPIPKASRHPDSHNPASRRPEPARHSRIRRRPIRRRPRHPPPPLLVVRPSGRLVAGPRQPHPSRPPRQRLRSGNPNRPRRRRNRNARHAPLAVDRGGVEMVEKSEWSRLAVGSASFGSQTGNRLIPRTRFGYGAWKRK